MSRALACLVLCLAAAAPRAEDDLRLETSTVTGNRELPRVMVIVPWKEALPGEIPGRPLNSLVEESMAPVDRIVFRRRLALHEALEAALPPGGAAPRGNEILERLQEE